MRTLATLCLLCVSLSGAGPVDDIRQLYYGTGEEIQNGSLYSTEVNVNSTGASFPGVGVYGRTVTFYWAAEPWASQAYRLVKAVVSSEVSAVSEYGEYLYDQEGELVFCFLSGGYDMVEHRFYFDDGRLVRFIDSGTVNDSPGQALGSGAFAAGTDLKRAFDLLH